VNAFTLMRSFTAPTDRVWTIIGDPGSSPGPGVDVTVERPGSADGAGLIHVVRRGRSRVREEITSVGPGYALSYRMLSGAPVRDYTGSVALDEAPDGGTVVRWSVSFRPLVIGTAPLISYLTKRSLKQVLDVIDARTSISP
jgi:Polyketide cyclase / dehydrase and lipid transport